MRTPPAPRLVKATDDATFGGYYRQLLDALDEPVLATDTRGRITYWNPAAERLLGWTADDAMGKPSDAFFPLADELSDDRERLLNQGSRWTGVWTGIRKDRTSVQAHLSVSPIPASEGERGGSVWRIRPVVPEPLEVERETTSIRDLEKELLRTVFANAPAFMAAFSGPDHVFELVNNTYCAYTGRQQSELLGQPLRCAIAELAEQGFIGVLDGVYRTGEPRVMNETSVCLDATPLSPAACFYVNIVFQPRWSDEGTIIGVLVHGVDVTEQVASRELVRSTARANELVMDRSIDVICTVDRDGIYRQVSRASESMWGYAPEELIGRKYVEFLHPDDRHTLTAVGDFVRRGGTLQNFRNRHLRRDGSTIEMMWACAWSEEDQCMFSVGRDITELNRQERELQDRTDALIKSEQRFRSLVYATSQVVWTANCAGQWKELSNSWTALTGQTAAEVASGGWQAVTHPDDVQRIQQLIEAAKFEGAPTTFEHRIRAVDGSYRWMQTRIVYLLDEDGQFRECVGTCTDIDDRKRAEAALMTSEARYRTMVDTASEGIWLLDSTGRTTFMNRRMAEMLGYQTAELMGGSLFDLVANPDRETMRNRFTSRSEGVSESYDVRFQHRCGRDVWAMVSASPFYDERGRFAGSLGMITDITERKRVEIELRHAKEEAEEMSRLKSSFLANMSHEFRTPLTAIIGYSDMLFEETTDEVQSLAQNIREGGERLLLTLDSVLALAQLESGSMKLSKRPIDVVQQVRDALPMFVRQAREKGITLRLQADPTSIHVPMDRGALVRIVTNLVDNAVKFTNAGDVLVRIHEQRAGVLLEIEDSGIGMGEAFLNRLFEDFQQESSGMARAYEGIGLGLSISMRLVRLLEGTLSVESEKGQGTRVSVWFPRP